MMDTERLARLMIYLAGAIVWAISHGKKAEDVWWDGERKWQEIKGQRNEDKDVR